MCTWSFEKYTIIIDNHAQQYESLLCQISSIHKNDSDWSKKWWWLKQKWQWLKQKMTMTEAKKWWWLKQKMTMTEAKNDNDWSRYIKIPHCIRYIKIPHCIRYIKIPHCIRYIKIPHCIRYIKISHYIRYIKIPHCIRYIKRLMVILVVVKCTGW